jgi:hypothetical protein
MVVREDFIVMYVTYNKLFSIGTHISLPPVAVVTVETTHIATGDFWAQSETTRRAHRTTAGASIILIIIAARDSALRIPFGAAMTLLDIARCLRYLIGLLWCILGKKDYFQF